MFKRIDDTTEIDTDFITCAEYQLFLDEMRTQGEYYQPDHWTAYTFFETTPKLSATDPVLGVRAEDAKAFVIWLNKREKAAYRLPTPTEAKEFPANMESVATWCYEGEQVTLQELSEIGRQKMEQKLTNSTESSLLPFPDKWFGSLLNKTHGSRIKNFLASRSILMTFLPIFTSTIAIIVSMMMFMFSLSFFYCIAIIGTVLIVITIFFSIYFFIHDKYFIRYVYRELYLQFTLNRKEDDILSLALVRELDDPTSGTSIANVLFGDLEYTYNRDFSNNYLLTHTHHHALFLAEVFDGQIHELISKKLFKEALIQIEQSRRERLPPTKNKIATLLGYLTTGLLLDQVNQAHTYYFFRKYQIQLLSYTWTGLNELENDRYLLQNTLTFWDINKQFYPEKQKVLERYWQLKIIEARADGELPAWEGIRLVRVTAEK